MSVTWNVAVGHDRFPSGGWYDVVIHDFFSVETERTRGYWELLEVLNPPKRRATIIINWYRRDRWQIRQSFFVFHEFASLNEARVAFQLIRLGREEEISRQLGFLVTRHPPQTVCPWFYK